MSDKHDRRTKQVIVMRKDLNMRKGKMVAQGAHASIAWLTRDLHRVGNGKMTDAERDWIDGSFVKICVGVDSDEELLSVVARAQELNVSCHLVTDAGFTEFAGIPTHTCCAVGPDWNERVDAVTGALKLL